MSDTEQPDPLNQQLRDDLVAYLDGELDEGPTQRIEHALASDSTLRNEVEALTRTWEMLDKLPRAKGSAEFTERTLATMEIEKKRLSTPGDRWKLQARRGGVAAVWAAVLALAATSGFLLTNRMPSQTDKLLDNLSLIERLDVYSEVKSVEFLRELQKSGLFDVQEPAQPE